MLQNIVDWLTSCVSSIAFANEILRFIWRLQGLRNHIYQRTGSYPQMSLVVFGKTILIWPQDQKYPYKPEISELGESRGNETNEEEERKHL